MQGKSTVSGDKASAKAHGIAVHKGAGVSLSVHHSEIHRVTSCGNPRLAHSPGSDRKVSRSQGCTVSVMFTRAKFLSRKTSKSPTGITVSTCVYSLANSRIKLYSNVIKINQLFNREKKKRLK